MKKVITVFTVVTLLSFGATGVYADGYGQYGQTTGGETKEEVKITHEVKETGLAENIGLVGTLLMASSAYFFKKSRQNSLV